MDFDHSIDLITPDITSILTIGGTGALELPSGATADQPVTDLNNGAIRYNTTISNLEAYIANAWQPLAIQSNASGDSSGCYFFDDFIATFSIPASTLATGSYCNDWMVHASGTGTSISNANGGVYVTSADNAIGVVALSTGTTSSGITGVLSNTDTLAFGYGTHYFECRVRVPTLPTSGQNFISTLGFLDQITSAVGTDQLAFVVNLSQSATNWMFMATLNGTTTYYATNVPLSASSWFKLRIEVTLSDVLAYVNESLVLTLPLSTAYRTGVRPPLGYGFKHSKTAGNTARQLLVDYLRYGCSLTTPR
jgi:hypothetical protein